jgi:hypothetical protein
MNEEGGTLMRREGEGRLRKEAFGWARGVSQSIRDSKQIFGNILFYKYPFGSPLQSGALLHYLPLIFLLFNGFD